MTKIKNGLFLLLSVLAYQGCNTDGFSSLKSTTTDGGLSAHQTPDGHQAQKLCELQAINSNLTDSNKISYGDMAKLKLKTNFTIPADAKIVFSGDKDLSSGLEFKSIELAIGDLEDLEFRNQNLFNPFSTVVQRQITISQGTQLLCASNTVTVEILPPSGKSASGISCVAYNGALRVDSTGRDVCKISINGLYHLLRDFNVPNSGPGLGDPCVTVGGHHAKANSFLCIVDMEKFHEFYLKYTR